MIAAFQGVCHTCGHDHGNFRDFTVDEQGYFNFTNQPGMKSEWGVWVDGEGIIYTAPCKTMCNDHINSNLIDDELKDYEKGMRLVEIFYKEPK